MLIGKHSTSVQFPKVMFATCMPRLPTVQFVYTPLIFIKYRCQSLLGLTINPQEIEC